MQDLKYPWVVGGSYYFKHPRGYWEDEVKILRYGDAYDEEEVFHHHFVEVMLKNTRLGLAEGSIAKLNADYKWIWEELNIVLENK